MRRRARLWMGIVGLGLALACSGETEPAGEEAEAPAEASGEAAEPGERDPAPELALPDLEGEMVRLSDLRGKTVVIDFWATWCPPCIFQVPILNEVQADWAERDVVVLGVAVDAEGREVVAPFAEEHGIEYRVLIGDEAVARDFGAPGFPALVIVWPDGTIEKRPPHVGLVERETLESELEEVQPAAS